MASAVTSLPGQQPVAAAGDMLQPNNNNIPQAVPSTSYSNWHSSGSVGPFFGVISVLAVLAILSCVVGRVCTGGRRLVGGLPLDTVKFRGFGWWMKHRGRWCRGRDVEVGGKVMVLDRDQEKQANHVKTKDGEVDEPQP